MIKYLGNGLRLLDNGNYVLPNPDKDIEKIMDAKHLRIPGKRVWKKRRTDCELERFKSLFDGKECYIVGKGPSLDDLSKDYFTDSERPVICINESIHAVERLMIPNHLFVIQTDTILRNTCKPLKATLLITENLRNYYSDYVIFMPEMLGLPQYRLTIEYAIKIAQSLGTTKFNLMCFDACVNGDTGYAECIDYKSDKHGIRDRFLNHRGKIENLTDNINWITPSNHVEEDIDIPQL